MDATIESPAVSPKTAAKTRRRSIVGASIGSFIEYYDIGIYALVAPTIATQFFPSGDPTAATLSTFAIFALGFIARPLGGLFFGMVGDRLGRTRALTTAILLMAAATVAIAFLPTFASVGALAPLLLLVCRIAQSVSVGGEFAGASSYLTETAAANKRGGVLGILNASVALPYIVSIGVVFTVSALLDDASFSSWGWRIPFLVAAPLGIIGLYLRMRLKESNAFTEMKKEGKDLKNPLKVGIRTQWRKMLLLLAAAAATATAAYTLNAYMVTFMTTELGYDRNTALVINAIAYACFGVTMVLGGRAADRFGRRPVVLLGMGSVIVVGIPAFLLMSTGNPGLALLGQVLSASCMGPASTVVIILATELFPTPVRYSCNALSYNLAYAIFGGSAPFIAAWLVSATHLKIAPTLYTTSLMLIVVILLAVFLKETGGKTVDELGHDSPVDRT